MGGDYTCLALNKGGERESSPASLTVLGEWTLCVCVRVFVVCARVCVLSVRMCVCVCVCE